MSPIDLFGPEQSRAGRRLWSDVMNAVRELDRDTGDGMESDSALQTPAALFGVWERICELYDQSSRDGAQITDEEARAFAHLHSELHQRALLVGTVLTTANFFGSLLATDSPPREYLAALTNSTDRRSTGALFVAECKDDSGSECGLDVKTARQIPPGEAHSTTTQPDEDIIRLRREFWRHKNELAQQNVASAQLQFDMDQTGFLEQRFSGSKRKVEKLLSELKHKAVNSENIQLARDELELYVQERKRLLEALLRRFAK